VSRSVTYRSEQPTITSVSPSSLGQTGGLVTVLGSNFGSSMTAVLTKDGGVITAPVIATVNNAGSLTFTAPFVADGDFNRQTCLGGGAQNIPTAFGVRVTNTQTGCSADLPGSLIYNPTNTACTLAITTAALSTAVACSPYSQTITVSGGTPPYSVFAAAGLPAGLSINPSTGFIGGTPVLASSGAGGSFTVNVTLSVQDVTSATTTKTLPILFSDPTGPFTVNGSSPQSVPASGSGPASAFSLPLGAGTGTISWSIDSPPAGLLLASATGATNSFVSSGLAPGTYSVTVRATDSLCAPVHTNTVTVTVNSP